MPIVDFYPIDIDYVSKGDKSFILIFGRTVDERRITVIDENYEPYFFVIPKDKTFVRKLSSKIEGLSFKIKDKTIFVKKVDIVQKNFFKKEITALKVYLNCARGLSNIKDYIKRFDEVINIYELDLPVYRRYLIDKKIVPLLLTTVEGEEIKEKYNTDLIINAKSIMPKEDAVLKNPKMLAFDIEVYNQRRYPNEDTDPIIMVAFHGNDGFSKVITWKKFSNPRKEIEFVDDEGKLILRFKEIIKEYQPDYLVGYFTDGFDFPYITARADKYKINLDLGLDNSNLRINASGTNISAKIRGIGYIDIYKFIRRVMANTLDVEDFDLDSVAKAIFNEGKTEVNVDDMYKAWDNDNEKLRDFCEYNLNDAKLTLRLLNVMLPNLIEVVKIIGLPLYDISRMTYGQLVEWYLIRNVQTLNEIIPNKPSRDEMAIRKIQSYEGAFVYEPEPGLYEEVAVFDFRSLYPSILASHNICPSTLIDNKEDSHETPEIMVDGIKTKYHFNYKIDGIVPSIIKDIILRRIRIKEMIKTRNEDKIDPILNARQDTLKLLANSSYGYLGFFGARWYSKECAASIAAYGRQYIKSTIEKAQGNGFKIIYSDTDSIFLSLQNKSRKDAIEFMNRLNTELPSLMELELSGFYPRGIFVMRKGEARGAKKKYALIDDKGRLKITGFETIRGDWSVIAKEVQAKVLELILNGMDKSIVLDYVTDIIKKIKKKEIPIEKMVIQKRLKKDIADYEAVGPHVFVAKMMHAEGMYIGAGSVISFVIDEGNGMIRDRAKQLKDCKTYDAEYYINNQIVPAVERIFEVLGIKKDLIVHHEQSRLGEF